MPRLIDIQDAAACPSPLTVEPGDVLMVSAAGARVPVEAGAVELLGPFSVAVLGANGEILVPAGPPGIILLRARRTGLAAIDIIVGAPFHGAPQLIPLSIFVRA